jgi:hypothetical protein
MVSCDTWQASGCVRFSQPAICSGDQFRSSFAAGGQLSGDTWHQSISDAQEQAVFEFENSISSWTPIPDSVEDVVAFCLAQT